VYLGDDDDDDDDGGQKLVVQNRIQSLNLIEFSLLHKILTKLTIEKIQPPM
jgi:hypothetical protein